MLVNVSLSVCVHDSRLIKKKLPFLIRGANLIKIPCPRLNTWLCKVIPIKTPSYLRWNAPAPHYTQLLRFQESIRSIYKCYGNTTPCFRLPGIGYRSPQLNYLDPRRKLMSSPCPLLMRRRLRLLLRFFDPVDARNKLPTFKRNLVLLYEVKEHYLWITMNTISL